MPKKSKKTTGHVHAKASLELDGTVYFVDRQPGKRAKRHPIDGMLVLQCVLTALNSGIDLLGRNLPPQQEEKDVRRPGGVPRPSPGQATR